MDLDKQKKIQKRFDNIHRTGMLPWKLHDPSKLLQEFLDLLKTEDPDAKLLDLGCGDGWLSLKAAKSNFQVWGLDSSPKAIEKAKNKSEKEGLSDKTDFQVGDALDLPYEDNFFSAMIDRGLFHHILPENRPLYLDNINRVLRKQSLVYLSVFSRRNPLGIGQRFRPEDIQELFGPYFEILGSRKDAFPSRSPAHLLHFILKKQ